jgi:hypothetical protein
MLVVLLAAIFAAIAFMLRLPGTTRFYHGPLSRSAGAFSFPEKASGCG